MREKLLKLMKSEKLTSSRLAEILEIQPSSISHILSGRNKPSYDFLVKILRRFPTLNPDWLLLDSEQMYRTSEELDRKLDKQAPQPAKTNTQPVHNIEVAKPANSASNIPSQNSTNRPTEDFAKFADAINDGRTIERVIILYTDKSFEAYYLK